MKKKLCTKCGRTRDATCYYSDSTRRDGLTAVCRDCRAAYYQRRKAATKRRAEYRAWRLAHPPAVIPDMDFDDPIREGVDQGIL